MHKQCLHILLASICDYILLYSSLLFSTCHNYMCIASKIQQWHLLYHKIMTGSLHFMKLVSLALFAKVLSTGYKPTTVFFSDIDIA